MTPLRTAVVMKTDISESTLRFRALVTADLQTLVGEHRTLLDHHAAQQGGHIVKPAGDGYWLEFPSVTAAAKAAVTMQEALRLGQLTKGDDRLAMRIVIGLGDVALQDGDLIGDIMALVARIEAITPPDQIYLTASARLAVTAAEIQTALVDSFSLKGFPEPVPVYRVERRPRTHIIADPYLLFSDLRGFTRIMEAGEMTALERILDALDAVVHGAAREFGGTIRFIIGDACCITFAEASQAAAAAEWVWQRWDAVRQEERSNCPINIVLHRGLMYAFRSYVFGPGISVAAFVERASHKILVASEGSIFVTGVFRDDLSNMPWHNQLHRVTLNMPEGHLAGIEAYRLTPARS